MTTPPRYERMLATGFTTHHTAQRAMGRNDDLADYSESNSDQTIQMTAEAWPHANDDNGVAYPAGLVAVRLKYNPFQSDALNNGEGYIVAVPDTLPAGHTASFLREHHHRKIRGFVNLGSPNVPGNTTMRPGYRYDPATKFTGSNVTDDTQMIRTDGALTPYIWMPENTGSYAYHTTGASPTLTLGWMQDFFGSEYPSAGFRYIRVKYIYGPYSPGTVTNLRFRVWRNNDCSTANNSPADVMIFELATATSTVVGPVLYIDSGFVMHDGGANNFYSPTPGTRCNFLNTWEQSTDGGATWTYINTADTRVLLVETWFGPRLDIPFPYMVTGDAGVVAPGGILAGTVPGY